MALVTMPRVEEVIEKNPEFRKTDLDILKDWLKKQPHLPQTSDYELMLFLHSNFYRTEPTKTTIDLFATFKTRVPEFFSKRDPLGCNEFRKSIKATCNIPMPSTTPEGYKVIYSKLLDFEPSHFILSDAIKQLFMVVELWLHIESLSPGHIFVIDMDGVKFGHLGCMNPMVLKKLVYFVQDAAPIRLKGLHFINPVPFMDMFINMARPFMRNELLNMLYIHSSLDSLNKTVPVDILPNEASGKAGPCQDLWNATIKKLEEHREWFLNDATKRVNEALRPGKAKYYTEIFGVEGSFKKLDID